MAYLIRFAKRSWFGPQCALETSLRSPAISGKRISALARGRIPFAGRFARPQSPLKNKSVPLNAGIAIAWFAWRTPLDGCILVPGASSILGFGRTPDSLGTPVTSRHSWNDASPE